ncbi:hypothetical protein Peur_057341 [Populus x canadensis]
MDMGQQLGPSLPMEKIEETSQILNTDSKTAPDNSHGNSVDSVQNIRTKFLLRVCLLAKIGYFGEVTANDLLLGIWSEVESPGHRILVSLGFNDEKAKELEASSCGLGFLDG